MNNQPVEQMNSCPVPTESESANNGFTKQTTTINDSSEKSNRSKSNGQLLIDNNTLNPQSNFAVNEAIGEEKLDMKSRKDYRDCSTSYLDNSTTSYQNDSSVYYTPVYKVQTTNQQHPNSATSDHHRSLIEPKTGSKKSKKNLTTTVINALDCSFDNSIVPIASCSSTSSERSSLNSTKLYGANNATTTNRHHKISSRRKDDHKLQQSTNENHLTQQPPKRRHRRLRRENYHLESSSELPTQPSKIESTHPNNSELISSQSGQFDNKLNLQNQPNFQPNQTTDPHQMAAHQNVIGGHELFDHLSNPNSPINTDDDSLPYFQTSSFSQDICNRLRWKLKYYFMNPIEKWKAKKKFPWKLLLQIIKIIFVTIHVLTYGSSMSRFLNHQGNMLITFRELLLNNWDPVCLLDLIFFISIPEKFLLLNTPKITIFHLFPLIIIGTRSYCVSSRSGILCCVYKGGFLCEF